MPSSGNVCRLRLACYVKWAKSSIIIDQTILIPFHAFQPANEIPITPGLLKRRTERWIADVLNAERTVPLCCWSGTKNHVYDLLEEFATSIAALEAVHLISYTT
jgi:hypothetical protein